MGYWLNALWAVDAIDGLDKVGTLAEDETALQLLQDSLPKRVRNTR